MSVFECLDSYHRQWATVEFLHFLHKNIQPIFCICLFSQPYRKCTKLWLQNQGTYYHLWILCTVTPLLDILNQILNDKWKQTRKTQSRQQHTLVVKVFCNFQASLNLKHCALSKRAGMLSSVMAESESKLKSTMQLESYKYPAWHFILALVSPCNIPPFTATETTFICLFVMSILNCSDWITQVDQ